MTEHHLLYWVFKVAEWGLEDKEHIVSTEITESDLKAVGAPEWVWVAYQEALESFLKVKSTVKA